MKREQRYPNTEYFHFHNANPKGRICGDCVVRAIAAATGKSWDEVFDGLSTVAKKQKLMTNDVKCYEKYLESLGWKKQKQPRKDDNTKYRGWEFCRSLQEDPWRWTGMEGPGHPPIVAYIGTHHIVCIKDGKVWDHWNSTRGCIGNYYFKSSETNM